MTATRLTTAMVLAAGRGERMRPLTENTPKPLVAVAGRALLDRLLDRLAAGGISRAVVNIHHLADQIESHLAGRRAAGQPPDLVLSDERAALLETGGGVRKALPLLGAGPFLVANADTLWRPGMIDPVAALAVRWDPAEMDALLLVASTAAAIGFAGRGDFLMDPWGRLERRPESDVAPFVYAGVGVFTARVFDDTPDNAFSLNLIFDRLIARGRLYGLRLDGQLLHVGTVDAIGDAEAALADLS